MLSPNRIVELKVALYHAAVKGDYVAKGFQVYHNINGHVVAVPTVGKPCRTMIAEYQRRNKLKVDGTFSAETQKHLIPVPPGVANGQKVANAALNLAELAPRHYTQARPAAMSTSAFISHGSDCSGFAILCFKNAGLPDPNGTDFAGYGNTWSLIARGKVATLSNLLPGDLIFYGVGDNPEHVTVYVGNGRVVSHGHEGGPLILPIHYRGDYIGARRYV